MGDQRSLSIVVASMGELFQHQGQTETALTYFNRALSLTRKIGEKFIMTHVLIDKAGILFNQNRLAAARAVNDEGLHFAQELDQNDQILKATMAVKIDYSLGEHSALNRLKQLLTETEKDADRADIHYELWKLTNKNHHRQPALTLYQKLFTKTPNIIYKNRIDELKG